MRHGWVLGLVGLAVFVTVGIATLPASLLIGRLPPELVVEGVSGSVWNGGADAIRVQGTAMGSVSWRAQPAALLHGELAYHVEVTRADGYVRGRIAAVGGGALTGERIEMSLPITALQSQVAADAWDGVLAGVVQSVRLERGWPVQLVGKFTVTDLKPPSSTLRIGTYEIDFDGRAPNESALIGRVRELEDAALLVRAQLAIRRDRSYLLEGEVTPRPNAAPEVGRAVAFLGRPDASGRRAFEITGSF